MHSCKKVTPRCKQKGGIWEVTRSQLQIDSLLLGDCWSLMNWQGCKYMNLLGHRRPIFLIPTHPTRSFCMNDYFFGESRCIPHAVLIRSNSEEEAREALSPTELSKPTSVAIYQNRGAIQAITHQYPPSRQWLLWNIEAQCDLCERIKISQRKDGSRPPKVLYSDK